MTGDAAGPAVRDVPVAVLGAGSWGTALAIQFARCARPTRLWGRDPAQLADMVRSRRNARYLPSAVFPETLRIESDLAAAVAGAGDLLIAVPSHAFRDLLRQIHPLLEGDTRLAWATKGFELASGLLPHQVAREVLAPQRSVAVLSGPTFAREVGAGLPTAMTIASADLTFAAALAQDLSAENFRAYTSSDVVGVEVGGAIKNVLAIGAGLADGLGLGANTRVALITRGLAEMMRLGVALGARRETFMGLAGLGDLVLTCTDDQSRNRQLGLKVAAGHTPAQALAAIGQVVEGYPAARALHQLAGRLSVEMPLSESVHRVLYGGVAPREAVRELMSRPIKSELE